MRCSGPGWGAVRGWTFQPFPAVNQTDGPVVDLRPCGGTMWDPGVGRGWIGEGGADQAWRALKSCWDFSLYTPGNPHGSWWKWKMAPSPDENEIRRPSVGELHVHDDFRECKLGPGWASLFYLVRWGSLRTWVRFLSPSGCLLFAVMPTQTIMS